MVKETTKNKDVLTLPDKFDAPSSRSSEACSSFMLAKVWTFDDSDKHY